ncbi:hypothetical protein SUGI_0853750, partial [Cryptomeria japonica]
MPISSVEHVLLGGIGTYSTSHILTYGQSNGKSEAGPPLPPPMVHVTVMEAKPKIAAKVIRKLNHWPPCEKRYFAYWLATRSKTDMLFIAKNAFILNSIDVNQQPILSSRKGNNHKQGK